MIFTPTKRMVKLGNLPRKKLVKLDFQGFGKICFFSTVVGSGVRTMREAWNWSMMPEVQKRVRFWKYDKNYQKATKKIHSTWSNYNDLTRPHPKWWLSKGNPLISVISRLVKYYNLARFDPKKRGAGLGWNQWSWEDFVVFFAVFFFKGAFLGVGEVKVKSHKEWQNHFKVIPIVVSCGLNIYFSWIYFHVYIYIFFYLHIDLLYYSWPPQKF